MPNCPSRKRLIRDDRGLGASQHPFFERLFIDSGKRELAWSAKSATLGAFETRALTTCPRRGGEKRGNDFAQGPTPFGVCLRCSGPDGAISRLTFGFGTPFLETS